MGRGGELVGCTKAQKNKDFYKRERRTQGLEADLRMRSMLPKLLEVENWATSTRGKQCLQGESGIS